MRSLADIAEHICQIKRRSDGNCFLKGASEHLFVSEHSNLKVDSPIVCDGYVKNEEAEVDRLVP